MTSERWKRIEEVYYGVLAFPPARRAVVLDEVCSDDCDIRREVESLLNARDQAGDFLSPEDLHGQITDLAAEPDLTGRTLGRYHIVSELGSGAMGEVYLARDNILGRQVALKILPARFTRNSERVSRFQREAKAASALNHPNIITIYDIGEVGETWFIVAEFINGITLRQRLAAGKMPVQEVAAIALQCARALQAAHQARILHRDIKPENIMIRPDGLVKVVDFGLARIANAPTECPADTTQAGAVIGTPRYMSPEQARNEELDARADVFSLGAVLYEMATGRPAFPGKSTAEVFAALLGSGPQRPPEGVPERLSEIISRALERDRNRRYQTMQEFADELERFSRGSEQVTPAVVHAGASPTPRRTSRTVLAALAFFVALGIAWYWRSSSTNRFPDVPPLSAVPLTSFAGFKDFVSFSPDGDQIAFSWNGGEGGGNGRPERDIYIKKIGPDDPVRLTYSTQDERLPVWSRDGHSIAFCRARTPDPAETAFGIYVISAAGGAARKIADGGLGVSWSPDGKWLAIGGNPSETGGISLISLRTGERRRLTNAFPYLDNLPAFSPDGKWVAFTRDFGFSAREIFVIPAAGGGAKQLTFDRQPTYGAAWTADSREIVFASNRGTGGESLWRISAKGGTPRRLSATLQGGFYPSIALQSNRLAYTETFKDTNIYAYRNAGAGNHRDFGPFRGPEGLILSSRRDDSPSISPNGERIAFVSKRTGNEEIWVCDRSGKHPTQLTSFKGPGTGTPRWSPDGRLIAFDSLKAGNPDIYVIGAEGGTPRRLTTGPYGNFMPAWSPDGKWIYFKSQRSGNDQIWRIPAEGGSAAQITRSGASEAFASPDGKLLFFTKQSWAAIWTVPVAGGEEKPVPELASFNKIFRSWGLLDRGIYFISREDTPHQTIRFFSFATRQVSPVLEVDKPPIWDYPDLAISRDERLLLFACLDHEVNDLMLIENFR